ncbi:MotA/TolQ/ExbB proton channel family protein [uncultured Aquimonas sp.]|uniref:MotA/TolQ/ExbB proton channel family protein n=1 Tax=uncultured Aquimonas sp. TaxID=385483 RepID=UPI000869FBCF|nr:MotA/TolQ/ExbB proton channel family protein [uncultured Aquimonas sp.]ODU43755.1 MAG: biopolymer transporter ExbB [Xanthomonadaceae bacterium SCN 69-123]
MLELLIAGGWVMWPILLCSALALAIIIERFWSLRRSKVLPLDLGDEVRQWAASGRLDPKHIETLRANSPLGAILAAAIEVRHRPREQMKERVEDVGRHQLHGMERFLNTLGTISGISPLLGLLGTVFGMIQMFLGILTHGVGDANQLAGGIGEALITTAAGLCVAIPAFMFYRYFRGRIAEYVVEMEQQVIALIDTLETVPQPGTAQPAARPRRPAGAAPGAGAAG